MYQQSDDVDQVVLVIEPTQIKQGIPSFLILTIHVYSFLIQQESDRIHQIFPGMAILYELEKWRQPFLIYAIDIDPLACYFVVFLHA
jgi:hypothetical protein